MLYLLMFLAMSKDAEADIVGFKCERLNKVVYVSSPPKVKELEDLEVAVIPKIKDKVHVDICKSIIKQIKTEVIYNTDTTYEGQWGSYISQLNHECCYE